MVKCNPALAYARETDATTPLPLVTTYQYYCYFNNVTTIIVTDTIGNLDSIGKTIIYLKAKV